MFQNTPRVLEQTAGRSAARMVSRDHIDERRKLIDQSVRMRTAQTWNWILSAVFTRGATSYAASLLAYGNVAGWVAGCLPQPVLCLND